MVLAQGPAHSNDTRTLYLLCTHSNISAVHALYQKMQQDLGADNVFLLFDDTSLVWPHAESMRITEPRSHQSPHVLLFNRTECEAVMGGITEHMPYFDQPPLVLFHRYMAGVGYDFVWRFDSDVRCNGQYAECLAGTSSMYHDFICPGPVALNAGGDTGWHWTRLGGRLASVPLENRRVSWVKGR